MARGHICAPIVSAVPGSACVFDERREHFKVPGKSGDLNVNTTILKFSIAVLLDGLAAPRLVSRPSLFWSQDHALIIKIIIPALTFAASSCAANATMISLEAATRAGACGGSISCFVSKDSGLSTANVTESVSSTLADGSFADANATADFGVLHVYSDAFRVTGSDAQSSASAWAVDVVPTTGGMYTASYVITGSHADVENAFGNSSGVLFNWDTTDAVTGAPLNRGQWDSTDAVPATTIVETFSVPLGHAITTRFLFETFTYSSFGVLDVADYSHTAKIYLTSVTPGPDVIGLSGHDYAPPSGVPEPSTWAMMLVGFGGLGVVAYRRAKTDRIRRSISAGWRRPA